jgi:hypothetical protein
MMRELSSDWVFGRCLVSDLDLPLEFVVPIVVLHERRGGNVVWEDWDSSDEEKYTRPIRLE